MNYASFRRNQSKTQVLERVPPASLAEWKQRLSSLHGSLSEVEGRRLLAEYGIRGPREQVAGCEEEACQVAQSIGFPVVLKILSPEIQHKTEAGGVKVGLKDRAAVASAYREVMESAHNYKPDARLEGVIIQEMIPADSVEVILGVLRDADFGPVVVFGSGGILVELVKDSALRLPPIERADALAMIKSTRGEKLLRGFRGRPAADIEALAQAVVGLSHLAMDLGDRILALEINPLMVLPEGRGVCAVDALVELA